MRIDLNSDLCEVSDRGAWAHDAAMFGVVTSANVACGGHAGNPTLVDVLV